ncbi:protein of unknown function [Streptococcus thermophilus]|nr:protein of unknown function [Streptococcus thermophilus]
MELNQERMYFRRAYDYFTQMESLLMEMQGLVRITVYTETIALEMMESHEDALKLVIM